MPNAAKRAKHAIKWPLFYARKHTPFLSVTRACGPPACPSRSVELWAETAGIAGNLLCFDVGRQMHPTIPSRRAVQPAQESARTDLRETLQQVALKTRRWMHVTAYQYANHGQRSHASRSTLEALSKALTQLQTRVVDTTTRIVCKRKRGSCTRAFVWKSLCRSWLCGPYLHNLKVICDNLALRCRLREHETSLYEG